MSVSSARAAIGLALLAACAHVDRVPPPLPPPAGPAVAAAPELAGLRCLLVAPFENASDLPILGEVATSALIASVDPEETRVFPVEDLRRTLRGTSLELPPEGASPRLALALAEKVGADGVVHGSVEGSLGSPAGLVVSVRARATAGRELLFASAAPVRPQRGEQVEVALRRALLVAARPMLVALGSPVDRPCFDPEVVRRARVIRGTASAALQVTPAPEPAGPPDPEGSLAPAPSPGAAAWSSVVVAAPSAAGGRRKADPVPVCRSELAQKLEGGDRFVLDGVEFAGRTAVLVETQGLSDLAGALAELPSTGVRIEVFVDATGDASADMRAAMARAMAVVRRLESLGIARERIAQEARGGEDPVVPNFTTRGRAANRRVEVVAVKAR